jgi:hemerythrin-like domain-containing protein
VVIAISLSSIVSRRTAPRRKFLKMQSLSLVPRARGTLVMVSFEHLIREHDELAEMADGLERVLIPARPNVARAIKLRTTLCTLLHDHLAKEDAEVYPRLMAAADPATAYLAGQFFTDYASLTYELTSYLTRWTEDAAAAEWRLFCGATRGVLTRLRNRISDENAMLYPTALAASAISLRV